MVFSTYKKQRILFFASRGLKAPAIAKELRKEDLHCSRVGIYNFLKKYEATGSIGRRVGSGRPSKITAEIKEIVEEQMRADDETTAYQLHQLLREKGYSISLRTILRCRTALGWTFRGGLRFLRYRIVETVPARHRLISTCEGFNACQTITTFVPYRIYM